ncbi:hypothetical protein [Haloarcula rubripromontorii]|uniref:hypothetical protein n=1 Tax=Haloarcula rubripromontorii TaxID=1705562 RepID=UPI00345BD188
MNGDTRRNLLKKMSAGAVVSSTVTISGTEVVSAEEVEKQKREIDQITEEYEDVDTAQNTFENNSQDVLEMLKSGGYLESSGLSQFPALDQHHTKFSERTDTILTTTMGSEKKVGTNTGNRSALLGVTTKRENVSVKLYVLPDSGYSYAYVEKGEKRIIVDPTSGPRPAGAVNKTCTDELCDHWGSVCMCYENKWEKVECKDGECHTVDTGCGGECCHGACPDSICGC